MSEDSPAAQNYFAGSGNGWVGWFPESWRKSGLASGGGRKLVLVVSSTYTECSKLMQHLAVVQGRLQKTDTSGVNIGFLGCETVDNAKRYVKPT